MKIRLGKLKPRPPAPPKPGYIQNNLALQSTGRYRWLGKFASELYRCVEAHLLSDDAPLTHREDNANLEGLALKRKGELEPELRVGSRLQVLCNDS